ncbi:asparagine synthase (glutamine-hydrolyzing) [Luteibaculum oceani]|uniref:asparagine synthase (glutamine-hydrolyzing) n=1 Tax=Luteibaculum oceani TaxID=1294296 RepID=A0A5C6V8N7_9FLAO|nr:asparagine synthase (glutamine-hydrolyzing) [Luteibaculum oceani]TXC81397.1 asparagine synthase (glutamine-hydrolyzing) [Luteibaculum oceani]
MCGIAGVISPNRAKLEFIDSLCSKMIHRGPDAMGKFISDGVSLGHTRLAIIDLDERANQPFYSNDCQIVVVYNGEIYNYQRLKKHIPYNYKTESDTEVIVAAYLQYGEEFVRYLDGMFAFILYDKTKNFIVGARDRLGIKPLYYSKSEDSIFLASELRALQTVGLGKKIESNALPQYLLYQHRFGNDTILEGIKELGPGHQFTFNLNSDELKIKPYWKLENIRTIQHNKPDAIKNIRDLLYQAVSDRLVADVPFGAFLSGGMDSSALVGIMSQISDLPVSTFHISFQEKGFSERHFAEEIAKKWRTNHEVLEITPNQFLESIPDAIDAYDYPGVDGINSWIISKITKDAGITMALSGAGGDELFGGYPVFNYVKNWRQHRHLRAVLSPFRGLVPMLPKKRSREKLFLQNIGASPEYIQRIVRQRLSKNILAEVLTEPFDGIGVYPEQIGVLSSEHCYSWVSQQELGSYIPSVLLRDTDQMSMAHALEVRVPFLDHRLVEYVLGLPDSYKIGKGNKPLMQEALGKEILPDSIVHRRKMGFTFPWDLWLKNDLREYSEKSLSFLKNSNHFKKEGVEKIYNGFLKGHYSYTVVLSLVILSRWMQKNYVQ